jgi:hypothetical protein
VVTTEDPASAETFAEMMKDPGEVPGMSGVPTWPERCGEPVGFSSFPGEYVGDFPLKSHEEAHEFAISR